MAVSNAITTSLYKMVTAMHVVINAMDAMLKMACVQDVPPDGRQLSADAFELQFISIQCYVSC